MPGKVDRLDSSATRILQGGLDASRLMEANQRTLRAALEAQSHGFQHCAKIGTSVFEFVQRRLKHDAELAQTLGAAKTPQDAYAAYHDFFDTAVREYSDEFTALATLYAEQTKEAMQDAEHQVDELARPVLTAAE
jgi:hypothetical protein